MKRLRSLAVRMFPEVLRDFSLGRRVVAVSTLIAAHGVRALASRASANGEGDLLVSMAFLGDQFRMLNVWSRFAHAAATDVICNAGMEDAFALYRGIGRITGFAGSGAASLGCSLRNVAARRKPYRRAIVPHPFVTQAIALAYAETHASSVYSIGDVIRPRGTVVVPLSAISWRAAYEALFTAVYGAAPVANRPALLTEYVYRGGGGIVLHLTGSTASRGITPAAARRIVAELTGRGDDVAVIGGAADRGRILALCSGFRARIETGKPLAEMAKLLAEARLFVGIDSSIMNLSDAVGTPSVIIYAVTDPRVAGPFYARSVAVTPTERYAPVGVDAGTAWKGRASSVSTITPERVLDAIDQMLDETRDA